MGIPIYCEVCFRVYGELELVQIKVGISFQYDMFPKEISTLFLWSTPVLEFIWHFSGSAYYPALMGSGL